MKCDLMPYMKILLAEHGDRSLDVMVLFVAVLHFVAFVEPSADLADVHCSPLLDLQVLFWSAHSMVAFGLE